MVDEGKLDVDAIAPTSAGLEMIARRRVGDIIKEWARILSVWGSDGTHGQHGEPVQETYSLADLAVACYVQGARDSISVSVVYPPAPDPDVLRELEEVEDAMRKINDVLDALSPWDVELHGFDYALDDQTLPSYERAKIRRAVCRLLNYRTDWADAIARVRRKLGGEG